MLVIQKLDHIDIYFKIIYQIQIIPNDQWNCFKKAILKRFFMNLPFHLIFFTQKTKKNWNAEKFQISLMI